MMIIIPYIYVSSHGITWWKYQVNVLLLFGLLLLSTCEAWVMQQVWNNLPTACFKQGFRMNLNKVTLQDDSSTYQMTARQKEKLSWGVLYLFDDFHVFFDICVKLDWIDPFVAFCMST